MNKTKPWVAFVVVAAFVAFLALGATGLWFVQQKMNQTSHSSWLKSFPDLRTLAKDADIIVTGKIVGVKATRFISDGFPPEIKAEIEKGGGLAGIVFTDYTFSVESVIKGNVKPGQSIVIVQTGGTYQGHTQTLDEDPLFKAGEATILFLKDISNDSVQSPGETKYIINGSPQSRYRVEGGRIVPMRDDSIGKSYRGKTPDEFVKAIRTVLTTP